MQMASYERVLGLLGAQVEPRLGCIKEQRTSSTPTQRTSPHDRCRAIISYNDEFNCRFDDDHRECLLQLLSFCYIYIN